MKPLTDSSNYKRFMDERDKALEQIMQKYQIANHKVLSVIEREVQAIATHITTQNQGREIAARNRHAFESRLKPWIEMAIQQTYGLMVSLRKSVYTLSYAGHWKAISMAVPIEKNAKAENKKQGRESPSGGELLHRVELYYHRLARKLIDAFQLSQVLESPVDETLERLERVFPKKKERMKPPKPMAKLHEAGFSTYSYQLGPRGGITQGGYFPVSDEDWNNAVEDYVSDEVPSGRSPHDRVFDYATDESVDAYYEQYQWELEQEITQDFVQSVRDGENDAANDLGITDFVFIAIIDNKTDECCAWRDGLLTSEIEKELKDEHSDDESDDSNPPIHVNCRCRLAPATDDLPDVPPADFESFDDWVAQKGKAA